MQQKYEWFSSFFSPIFFHPLRSTRYNAREILPAALRNLRSHQQGLTPPSTAPWGCPPTTCPPTTWLFPALSSAICPQGRTLPKEIPSSPLLYGPDRGFRRLLVYSKICIEPKHTEHWESRTHNVKKEHLHSQCSGRQCSVQHRKATCGDGEGSHCTPGCREAPPGAYTAGPRGEGWAVGQKVFQSHRFHPGAVLSRRILNQDYVNIHTFLLRKYFPAWALLSRLICFFNFSI